MSNSTHYVHTIDLTLASILCAFGIPIRKNDPVTCIVETKDGKKHDQFTFWFEITDPATSQKNKQLMDAYHAYKQNLKEMLDGSVYPEGRHPLYNMIDAFLNRVQYLKWMKEDVTPMTVQQFGEKTLIFPLKPSAALVERMRPHLK